MHGLCAQQGHEVRIVEKAAQAIDDEEQASLGAVRAMKAMSGRPPAVESLGALWKGFAATA